MPKDAVILKIGIESVVAGHPNLCVWAHIYTNVELEERRFRIYESENPLPADVIQNWDGETHGFVYIDTVVDRTVAWHVFSNLTYHCSNL